MNAGISTNGQDLDSVDLEVIFDFEIFFREGSRRGELEVEEMSVHNKIIDSNFRDLLKKIRNFNHKFAAWKSNKIQKQQNSKILVFMVILKRIRVIQ